ncbi:CHAT domain-containing protein [Rapidithrix thailandica]|uniref:CHAT domain-containing protein n=1 Tax=Rapidithrix thailandica TaxID=413964 RepID=A0AAW9S9U2_9BACT
MRKPLPLIFCVVLIFIGNIHLFAQLVSQQEVLPASGTDNPSPAFVDYQYENPELQEVEDLFLAENYFKASDLYLQYAKKFQAENEWEGYLYCLNQYTDCLRLTRNFNDAKIQLTTNVRDGKTYLGEEHPLVATAYYLLGICYDYTNQPDSALYYHNTALQMRLHLLGEQHLDVAKSYNGIGDVYRWYWRDYYNADHFYTKSLNIKEQLDQQSENVLSSRNFFVSYYNLATTNRGKGDLDRALFYGLKALSLIDSASSRANYCHSMLANIYNTRNQLDKATFHYQKAIELYKLSKSKIGWELPVYYNNLGYALRKQKHYDSALQHFYAALRLGKKLKHQKVLSDAYMGLADLHLAKEQYDSAAYYYKKLLSGNLKFYGERHRESSKAKLYIGNFYQARNEYDRAVHYYQAAIDMEKPENDTIHNILEKSKTNLYLYQIIGAKAKTLKKKYLAQKDSIQLLTQSIEASLLADSIIDIYRTLFIQEGAKLYFSDKIQPIYEQAIDCAYLLYNQTKDSAYTNIAFQFIEKSKSRVLLESILKAELKNQAGLPDSLFSLEKKLQVQLAHYRNKLHDEEKKATPDQAKVQSFQNKIFEIIRSQEKLSNSLQKNYPNYYSSIYHKRSVRFSELLAYHQEHNIAVLEYYWGKNAVYAIGVDTHGDIFFKKIDNNHSLYESVLSLISLIKQGPLAPQKSQQDQFHQFTEVSLSLYRQIFPFKRNPEKVQKLLIIPDGPLAFLPFDALISQESLTKAINYKNLAYLHQEYCISYAYSYELLKHHRFRQSNKQALKMLALSYSSPTSSKESDILRSNGLTQDILNTSRELDAIQQILPGNYLKGKAATEDYFKKHATQYDLIHLALHGSADQEQNQNTLLRFRDDHTSEEDGRLHPYELYNLNLNAQLVVLSACESGLGKLYQGEGVYSMARAFTYAGSPTIVMSLWEINDRITADIMSNFYQQLNEGHSIDEGLYQAKNNYLNSSDPLEAHPLYWASFVPLGKMTRIVTEEQMHQRQLLQWVVIAALVITLGLLSKKILKKIRK